MTHEPKDSKALSHDERWMLRLEQARHAARMLGRLPQRGDQVPAGLVDWLKNQRRSRSVTPERAVLLETLPGWSRDPRGDHHDVRLRELAAFLEAHGRRPRRRSTSSEERGLAEWVARQERAASTSELGYARAELLNWVLRGGDHDGWIPGERDAR